MHRFIASLSSLTVLLANNAARIDIARAARMNVEQEISVDGTDLAEAERSEEVEEEDASAWKAWPFSSREPAAPEGGCPKNSHFSIDPSRSDRHVTNPFGEGDLEEQHFILQKSLGPNEQVRGKCNILLRSSHFLIEPDELWPYEETQALDFLDGEMTVICRQGKLELVEDEFGCREYLPFSSIYEYFPHPVDSRGIAQARQWDVNWDVTLDAGRFDNLEIGYYDCGKPPPQLVLEEKKCSAAGPNCLPEAARACSKLFGCKAISVSASTFSVIDTAFQLLSGGPSSCPPAQSTMRMSWKKGDAVRLLGIQPDGLYGGLSKGTVAESWQMKSSEHTVAVQFQGSSKVERVPYNKLRPLEAPIGLRFAATKIRERDMHCGKMKADHTCDVDALDKALILFDNSVEDEFHGQGYLNETDCHEACLEKAQSVTLEQSCCVFHYDKTRRGVCALMPGKPFEISQDRKEYFEHWDELAELIHNAKESAASCSVRECYEDPLCSFGAVMEFEAPPDAEVPPGHIQLLFDFANPLSMSFSYKDSNKHASMFHFTSKHKPPADPNRLVRVIGSVPDDKAAKSFIKAANKSRETGSFGFSPDASALDSKMLREVQERLQSVCEHHGQHTKRELSAPQIDLETRDMCLRKFAANSPKFQPCLVEIGCKRLDSEGSKTILPFHGPWFPQLPFDIMAWQQPAPMCCGSSNSIDRREEKMFKEFIASVGFQDPDKVDLDGVTEEAARSKLQNSIDQGSNAMKHFLAHEVVDQSALDYLTLFLKEAKGVMNNYMYELQEQVDADGGDDLEIAADGNRTALLQVHEEGDVVAPSGQRAFEVAVWNEKHGAFVQVGATSEAPAPADPTWHEWAGQRLQTSAAWVGKQLYSGLKWTFKALKRWAIPIVKWIVENPKTALFLSKIALVMRNQLCKKWSHYIYGNPEVQYVGLFQRTKNATQAISNYTSWITPGTMLTTLHSAMNWDSLKILMKGLGAAAFTSALGAIGVATGGAFVVALGGVASFLTDMAFEAAKESAELLVYKELAKEIPSNIFDMLFSKCSYKRETQNELSASVVAEEAYSGMAAAATKATGALEKVRSMARAMTGNATA